MTDTTELRRRLRERHEPINAHPFDATCDVCLLLDALDAQDAAIAGQIRFAADQFSTETPDFDREHHG